jgi:putative methionine-R-sulfoxide reductase with GAF domain
MKRYRTPREVLAESVQVLSAKTKAPGRNTPLQGVVDVIASGRHYFWTAIYLVVGERVMLHAASGPVCLRPVVKLGEGIVGTVAKRGAYILEPDVSTNAEYLRAFAETKSELAVPIKIGTHVLGVINFEHRQTHGLSTEDRVMAEKIAHQLARFLSVRGQYVMRKLREAARLKPDEDRAPSPPVAPALKPERAAAARAGHPVAVGDPARK